MNKLTLSNKTCIKLGFVQEDGRNYDKVELDGSTVRCYTSTWSNGLIENCSLQVSPGLVRETEEAALLVEAAYESAVARIREVKNRYNRYLCELEELEEAQRDFDKALADYNNF